MEPVILGFWRGLAASVFVIICVLLMFVILIQKGRGGGLSGAFGGAGAHTAFGAKTGDVFTWITVVLAGLFIVSAVLLNYVFRPIKPAIPTPPAQPARQAPAPDQRPSQQERPAPPGPAQPPPAPQQESQP